ncbi:MAG: T9SS type A sorting domain-containing protein, partial [Bacteroidota bacterium]|nr:T9SS type A sorting domain-containing protein [Bacteroidota bacterium]
GIDYYYSEHKSQVGDQDICMVTVDSSTSKNLIAWEREQSTDIDGYKVYKETFQANVYDSIGYVPYNKLSVFIDTSSRPAVRANRYKVSTIFNDGNESYLSKHHKTIHLTANTGTSGENNLIWSHYEGFTFSSYKIYRGTNPANISLLDSVPSNLTSYTDVNPPAGVVFYQVVVDLPYICDPSIFRAQGTSGPFSHSLSNLKDYSQSSNDYLIISPSAVSIDINARIFYLTVFTNLKTWSVTADQSWLTVIEDIDGGRILVNVDKNTETSERTAEITVSGSGVSNFNISLTQGITNSVEEELKDDFIVVTPNPFTDKLSVNNLSIANDILKIELYDLNGKRYFQSENPELFTEIDCSDLKSGMYILKAISKDKAYTYLLVKQ